MNDSEIKRAMKYADEHYDVRTGLRFLPHMTLQAAARIAAEHGCELRVTWNGKQAVVEAVRIQRADFIPPFLRPQCDPSGGADFEKVVKLVNRG